MATKPGDLTTMWHFSATRLVLADVLRNANVEAVSWLETHGDSGTFQVEFWKQLAPNIYVVTSQKK